jgi:glutaredoxin 3
VPRRQLVEEVEEARQRFEGAGVSLLLAEEAQHRLSADEADAEAVAVVPGRLVRADQLDAGHRVQLAASLMEHELRMRERLEPSAEARLRAPDPLRNRTHPAPVERVQVEHAVRLAEAQRAQHHRLRRVRPSRHPASLGWCAGGTNPAASALYVLVARVQMYTTRWCVYCTRAKVLLEGKEIAFEEISMDDDPAFRRKLVDLTGGWTVPQILIDGRPIGGYTELRELERAGCLEQLLDAA